jgi:hypothetical protein
MVGHTILGVNLTTAVSSGRGVEVVSRLQEDI